MVERRTSVESFSLAQRVSSPCIGMVTHPNHLKDADNIVNTESGGYDHVTEFIPIGQPNAGTLAKLATLEPSTEIGDRKLIFLAFHPDVCSESNSIRCPHRSNRGSTALPRKKENMDTQDGACHRWREPHRDRRLGNHRGQDEYPKCQLNYHVCHSPCPESQIH